MEDTEDLKPTHKIEYLRLPLTGMVVSLVSLMFIVTSKDPGSGGPVVIMCFLLLVFVASLTSISLLLQYIVKVFRIQKFSWGRLLYTSVALAAGVVFLIGLQTLHQLQLIDVVLVFVFEIVLTFYLLRRF